MPFLAPDPKGACQRLGLSSPQVVEAIQPKRCLPKVGAIQPTSGWGYPAQKVLAKGWGYPVESVAKSWGFPAKKCWGYPAQEVLQQADAVFFSHALLSLLQPAIFISFQALTSPRLLPLSSIFFHLSCQILGLFKPLVGTPPGSLASHS